MAETDVKISPNEKSSQPPTVFIDGLNFLNSYWQFFVVNVWMVKCDAASLTLELTNIRNVTIENCTFGNWTFRQVEDFMIKNSRNSVLKDFPTLLRFYNSSGLIENTHNNDLNFTKNFNGLIIESNSYVQVTKSKFVNNTVTLGLIKVLNSSTLEMRDCTLQKNKAIDYAGAIYADRSFINLTKSNFKGNKAIQGGGALHVREGSILYMESCSFSNNQVKLLESAEEKEVGQGGAILLSNSTVNGINVNFTGNKGGLGGGLACLLHSQVTAQHMDFSHNIAAFGSAIYGLISCKFSCKNCSLYENIGSAILLTNNSYLVAVSSSFLNNTAPKDGTAICSINSILDLSHCTFRNNSKTAMRLVSHTKALLGNCFYESNSTPHMGGALIINDSSVTALHTTFLENYAFSGGAVYAVNHSSLLILNCSILRNAALNYKHIVKKGFARVKEGGGGAICIQMSVLKIYESQFHNNFGELIGIVCSFESSLVIYNSIFQNNISAFTGSVIHIYNNSSLIINGSSLMNNSVGGVLQIDTNSNVTISNVHLFENKVIMDAVITAADFSNITIFNSSFETNKGSVIYIHPDASLQMNHCVFLNNSKCVVSVSSSSVITIKKHRFQP